MDVKLSQKRNEFENAIGGDIFIRILYRFFSGLVEPPLSVE